MSLKDESHPLAVDLAASPGVVPVTSVSPDTRVHHFDELSDRTQHALAHAADSGTLALDPESTRLARGDVIVFTQYFRVQ